MSYPGGGDTLVQRLLDSLVGFLATQVNVLPLDFPARFLAIHVYVLPLDSPAGFLATQVHVLSLDSLAGFRATQVYMLKEFNFFNATDNIEKKGPSTQIRVQDVTQGLFLSRIQVDRSTITCFFGFKFKQ